MDYELMKQKRIFYTIMIARSLLSPVTFHCCSTVTFSSPFVKTQLISLFENFTFKNGHPLQKEDFTMFKTKNLQTNNAALLCQPKF